MRGLIQKDMCLMLQRSRIMLVMIGVGVLMVFSTDGTFVIGYITMLCAILTVSTISYDEYDNGYPFLLTLPITKRTYVAGKYLFCLAGGLIGWAIAVAIYLCCSLIKGNSLLISDLLETLAFIPVFGLITVIMIPLQLKYGAEKSRIAIAVVGGGAWALGYLFMRYLPDIGEILAFLSGLSDVTMMVFLLVLFLAVLAISYRISLRIMEKKEY